MIIGGDELAILIFSQSENQNYVQQTLEYEHTFMI